MTWDAVIGGKEEKVFPTDSWIKFTLSDVRHRSKKAERFVCLIRNEEDQLNALCVNGAFILEWYRQSAGGRLIASRAGEKPTECFERLSLIARFFGAKRQIQGSLFDLNEAATIFEAYVNGATEFPSIAWYRPAIAR